MANRNIFIKAIKEQSKTGENHRILKELRVYIHRGVFYCPRADRWTTKIDMKAWRRGGEKKTLAALRPLTFQRVAEKRGDLERLLFLKVSSLPPSHPIPNPLSLPPSFHPSFLSRPSSSLPSSPPQRASQRQDSLPPGVAAQTCDSERGEARSRRTRRPLLELWSCWRNCASHFICAFPHTQEEAK